MVINAKVKPSLARTISNTASGPLLLDFKPIQIVRTMKYLGCIISSNNKANEHLLNRKVATITARSKLEDLDIFNEKSNPR